MRALRIKISTSATGEVYAELTDENPETAKAVWEGLPIEGLSLIHISEPTRPY